MVNLPRFTHLDLAGKRVIVRVDLNVPMTNGTVDDFSRITRVLPTIQALQKQNAKIILISHFGRPHGVYDASKSLKPLADILARTLGVKHITFADDVLAEDTKQKVEALQPGDILLIENLRFYIEEEKNDRTFAKKMAALGDFYINDAFACSHRAHASLSAITEFLPSAAGLLMLEEIETLEQLIGAPKNPILAIVGGAKISTKLALLKSLMQKVRVLAVGGAMANTFLKAQGKEIGRSLCEPELLDVAKEILSLASTQQCELILPEDVVVAEALEAGDHIEVVSADDVPPHKMILDIGPRTIEAISRKMSEVQIVLWNGPLGAFEQPPFDQGTTNLARHIVALTLKDQLVSVAGGGDIISALTTAELADHFTYISTAGGAFLEWLEGKELPGIVALTQAPQYASN